MESFKDHDKVPEGVEVRAVLPQLTLEPYKGYEFPETWQEDAKRVTDALKEHCRDADIIVTHDWVFIDTYIPYNIGLREAQLPGRQFHWIHSAPSGRPELVDNPHANRYTLPPNSKLVYLNNDKTQALAEMYGAWPRDIRVIHNSRDPRTFWNLDPFVKTMIDKYDLLNADIVSVYPVSTPRMIDGKQVDVVIKLHAYLNQMGYSTRLIVPNAHCNAKREQEMVQSMMDYGAEMGLAPHQILFTSREGHENGVPANIVSDFFRLSNIFFFPSVSENCSLVLLEAELSGNLLVLNSKCSGLKEFGGKDALYFSFGNVEGGERNYETNLNKDIYYEDIAKVVASEFDISKPLQAKRRAFKKHNYDYIFKQIERLYYED